MKLLYLERIELDGNKVVHQEKLLQDIGRVRNVAQSPDGTIYVSVEGGKIIKIIPVLKK
jgi:glucose/arabinose dehydrogenase